MNKRTKPWLLVRPIIDSHLCYWLKFSLFPFRYRGFQCQQKISTLPLLFPWGGRVFFFWGGGKTVQNISVPLSFFKLKLLPKHLVKISKQQIKNPYSLLIIAGLNIFVVSSFCYFLITNYKTEGSHIQAF